MASTTGFVDGFGHHGEMNKHDEDAGQSWGPWHLIVDNLTLEIRRPNGTFRYGVDLEKCLTSAQTLDWIIQVAKKQWATDEIIGQLVKALDAILAPQSNLCSFGEPKVISPERLRDLASSM